MKNKIMSVEANLILVDSNMLRVMLRNLEKAKELGL